MAQIILFYSRPVLVQFKFDTSVFLPIFFFVKQCVLLDIHASKKLLEGWTFTLTLQILQ